MPVTVNKLVLENFIKKMVENRTSGEHDTSKIFDMEEEEPIKPAEMMSTQLAVEAPPVDDPEYLPGTNQELGRAAQLIADEVPESQIEKFYRDLHKLLDMTLDDHNDSKLSNKMYESLIRILEGNHIRRRSSKDVKIAAAVKKLQAGATMQNVMELYGSDPEFSGMDRQELEDLFQDELVKSFEASLDSQDAPTEPPPDDTAPSPDVDPEQARIEKALDRDTGEVEDVDTSRLLDRSLTVISRAASLAQLPDNVGEFEGLEYLVKVARTWEFSDEIPYLDVVFLTLFGLHELSYMVQVQGNYMQEYGGLQLAPRDTGFGTQMTITSVDSGPSSKAYARGILKDIKEKYGLDYQNMMHLRNLAGMSDQNMKKIIVRALTGMARHNNLVNRALNRWAADEGDQLKSVTGVIDFLGDLFVETYKLEIQYEKRELERPHYEGFDDDNIDFVDQIIGVFFSQVRKGTVKRGEKRQPPFYYTNDGFDRNAHEVPDLVRDMYPELIFNKMKKSRLFKKRLNKFVLKHPQISDFSKEFSDLDMKEEISRYVEMRIQFSIDLNEEQATSDQEQPEDEGPDIDDLIEESEELELQKILRELEKRANPTTFTHMAPYFGFSGESGLRQWMLKYPERKIRIHAMSKTGMSQGAKKFVDVTETLYDRLSEQLPAFIDIYIELIEAEMEQYEAEIAQNPDDKSSKAFGPVMTLLTIDYAEEMSPAAFVDEKESKDDDVKLKLTKQDVVEFGRELIKLLELAKKEISTISEAMGELSMRDLSRAVYALEQEESIPADIMDDFPSNEERTEIGNLLVDYQDAMHRVGGIIVRGAVGDVMNDIISKIDKPWHTKVIEKLTSEPYDLDPKVAKKFSEHFTGKKNVPNFAEMRKSAKDMVAAGITSEEFFNIYEDSYMILDSILDEQLAEKLNLDVAKEGMSDADKKKLKKQPKNLYEKIVSKYLQYNLYDRKIKGAEREEMIEKVSSLYLPLIAMGIKEFDNLVELQRALSKARLEAEEYREQINEIRYISSLVEEVL